MFSNLIFLRMLVTLEHGPNYIGGLNIEAGIIESCTVWHLSLL